MFINILIRLILGYVKIEVEGYYIEKFINQCAKNKIFIWNLKKENEVKLYLNIGKNDFKNLKNICQNTKCKIKIKRKQGLPFFLHRYKKRKIFVVLLIIVAISIYISSGYVWNIEIEVEDNLELENIMTDLEELGLKKGAKKDDINTEEIIDKLQLKRDDISWIGIDIKGTNVIVKIVKADEEVEIIDDSDYCNIVATKAGTITKITAQNGTALVTVGDEVEEGQILIAGYMEGKYTDTRYVHSMGEVEANVNYTESMKVYYYQEILTQTGEEETKFQIIFNNFQINFYKTLSKFQIYDTIYTEQNLKIFSNFYLPISIVKVNNKEQQIEKKNYTIDEAISIGVEELSPIIEEQIEDKEKILRNKNSNR